MKLCYIDVETGGVDSKTNALLQLAGIIEIDGKIIETFNWKMYPFEGDVLTQEALDKTGITLEDIENSSEFQNPKDIYKKFIKVLGKYVNKFDKKDKFFLVTYNGHAFDLQFLIEWFKKCNDVYFMSWFWYPTIDVMLIAVYLLMEERSDFPNFKLTTIAQELLGEVDESKAHDAMYDIELTRKIYKELT